MIYREEIGDEKEKMEKEKAKFAYIEKLKTGYVAWFYDFGEAFALNKKSLAIRIENLKKDNLGFNESEKALKAIEEAEK